jgi:hypothetical protein
MLVLQKLAEHSGTVSKSQMKKTQKQQREKMAKMTEANDGGLDFQMTMPSSIRT